MVQLYSGLHKWIKNKLYNAISEGEPDHIVKFWQDELHNLDVENVNSIPNMGNPIVHKGTVEITNVNTGEVLYTGQTTAKPNWNTGGYVIGPGQVGNAVSMPIPPSLAKIMGWDGDSGEVKTTPKAPEGDVPVTYSAVWIPEVQVLKLVVYKNKLRYTAHIRSKDFVFHWDALSDECNRYIKRAIDHRIAARFGNDFDPSSAAHRINGIEKVVKHPVAGRRDSIHNIIINLNDKHKWTREAIADWLETLDEQPEFTVIDGPSGLQSTTRVDKIV